MYVKDLKLGDHIILKEYLLGKMLDIPFYAHHGIITQLNPIGVTHFIREQNPLHFNDKLKNFIRNGVYEKLSDPHAWFRKIGKNGFYEVAIHDTEGDVFKIGSYDRTKTLPYEETLKLINEFRKKDIEYNFYKWNCETTILYFKTGKKYNVLTSRLKEVFTIIVVILFVIIIIKCANFFFRLKTVSKAKHKTNNDFTSSSIANQ